jgi:hypothetical protein
MIHIINSSPDIMKNITINLNVPLVHAMLFEESDFQAAAENPWDMDILERPSFFVSLPV